MGKEYIATLDGLLNSIMERECNSEKFIVFQLVTLQRTRDVKNSSDIRKRISRRLEAWNRPNNGAGYAIVPLGESRRHEDRARNAVE